MESDEAMDVEAQMAAARAEAAGGGGEGSGSGAGGGGGEEGKEVEMVAPEVNEELLKELEGMGFGTNRWGGRCI